MKYVLIPIRATVELRRFKDQVNARVHKVAGKGQCSGGLEMMQTKYGPVCVECLTLYAGF